MMIIVHSNIKKSMIKNFPKQMMNGFDKLADIDIEAKRKAKNEIMTRR